MQDVPGLPHGRLATENGHMFINAVAEDAAVGAVADYYRSQHDSWGFLPNYAACFATRPDVATAWDQLNGTIRNSMDRRRFEIGTIAAARALKSTYCTTAHSKFLRDICGDEPTFRSIAEDPRGATLDSADRAVYAFATKLATDASTIQQTDVDALHASGLSDADVADLVFAVAARSFFTTVLDGLGAQLDPQTAATIPSDLLDSMVVGRPVANG
jgi:uncharacterized peroxidase-related enzyme